MLLRTVVEVALDPATVGIGGSDEPFSGRPQLPDLEAQPVERLVKRFDARNFQVDRPPARGCPRKLSVIARPSSRGASTPTQRGGSLPPQSPAATVVPPAATS
jgi:hypothetical protein